jgi:hypothetical protein
MAQAECGTLAAYRRHLRAGEDIDEQCAAAVRDDANQRRQIQRSESARAVRTALDGIDSTPDVDPLDDATENLRIVIAAMSTAPANAIAGLSKRRQELVTEIQRLQSATPQLDPLDEIASRRAQRGAWHGNRVRQAR